MPSKYSLEQCELYANHLNERGQGVKNPKGFARAIFVSGSEDELMSAFFTPAAVVAPPRSFTVPRDPSCAQCDGTGFVKTIRSYNGVQVVGRLSRERQLVRCDHVTTAHDSRRGEVVTLEPLESGREF